MDASALKIIFAGTPEFAVPSLRALLDTGYEICTVLTQPDRRSGRGRKIQASPVKRYAAEHGLSLLQPENLKDAAIHDELRERQPDIMIVAAYGLLLPSSVLDLPRFGCVNVHASLLPRWRGASPIQAAILHGDSETGVSIMRMEEGLDTGPVYATRSLPIDRRDTAASLDAKLALVGAELLIDILPDIIDGTAVAEEQAETGATHAGRIRKSDGVIDWSFSADEIDRKIRAFNPWPVAYTSVDGQRMRCWSALALSETTEAAEPGTVLAAGDTGIDVQTGDGVLRLLEIQMPGKQRLKAAAFANGYPVVSKCLGAPD